MMLMFIVSYMNMFKNQRHQRKKHPKENSIQTVNLVDS